MVNFMLNLTGKVNDKQRLISSTARDVRAG
jgi:hypothetical protein